MKENKYDDPIFFEKYKQMERSQQGLSGAGEWETLKKILPDFTEKKVLDLGCGYGWHAIYAAEHGAKSVIATDLSEKMLEVAKEKNMHPAIKYQCMAFEDSQFKEAQFDVILCSLMLHYLKSYHEFLEKTNHWLKSNGTLIFTVEHPVFTSYGSQDWYYDEHGKILHFPVDRYFIEGKREALFLGESVTKYHRTLTTYLEGLLNMGYQIKHVIEPKPTEKALQEIEGMKEELRRPMMLIISAQKYKKYCKYQNTSIEAYETYENTKNTKI